MVNSPLPTKSCPLTEHCVSGSTDRLGHINNFSRVQLTLTGYVSSLESLESLAHSQNAPPWPGNSFPLQSVSCAIDLIPGDAQFIRPGSLFEMQTETIFGREYKVFTRVGVSNALTPGTPYRPPLPRREDEQVGRQSVHQRTEGRAVPQGRAV